MNYKATCADGPLELCSLMLLCRVEYANSLQQVQQVAVHVYGGMGWDKFEGHREVYDEKSQVMQLILVGERFLAGARILVQLLQVTATALRYATCWC